jgi:hypothetical protein
MAVSSSGLQIETLKLPVTRRPQGRGRWALVRRPAQVGASLSEDVRATGRSPGQVPQEIAERVECDERHSGIDDEEMVSETSVRRVGSPDQRRRAISARTLTEARERGVHAGIITGPSASSSRSRECPRARDICQLGCTSMAQCPRPLARRRLKMTILSSRCQILNRKASGSMAKVLTATGAWQARGWPRASKSGWRKLSRIRRPRRADPPPLAVPKQLGPGISKRMGLSLLVAHPQPTA